MEELAVAEAQTPLHDYDYELAELLLDSNGFPSFQQDDEEEGSFAADFYSSGADWSSLMANDRNGGKRNSDGSPPRTPNLKQANLFQMWGLKKPRLDLDEDISNSKLIPENSNAFKRKGINQAPRICPFYKKIPGTSFSVDAFRYGSIQGCSVYFLTHFHYDHYGGLSKKWSHGPIYCSPITARLVRLCLYVDPVFICPLELNTEHVVDGIKVTLLEANHCPGAALIHFGFPDGQFYLHTGDFRASKMMQTYPLLLKHRVNVLYLDTTYCNPRYKFPSKEDVLSFVVRATKNHLKRQPKTLVVVGAYSIGKECVYVAISKALGIKIHTNASRRRILKSFDWPELTASLCDDGKGTFLHVLPISSLKFETLNDYLTKYTKQFVSVLAFRPTGWTYSEKIGHHLDLIKPNVKGNITIYGVPYSEHSSFTELRDFVQFLRPDKIIPTVNIRDGANRDKMNSYFRQWLNA